MKESTGEEGRKKNMSKVNKVVGVSTDARETVREEDPNEILKGLRDN